MIGQRPAKRILSAMLLAAVLAAGLHVGAAPAQTYLDCPVKIIVPTPPGGPVP